MILLRYFCCSRANTLRPLVPTRKHAPESESGLTTTALPPAFLVDPNSKLFIDHAQVPKKPQEMKETQTQSKYNLLNNPINLYTFYLNPPKCWIVIRG